MNCQLNPTNLAKDNIYYLRFTFTNEENECFRICKAQLQVPDLKITLKQEINQILDKPFWIFKKSKDVTFTLKINQNKVKLYSFTIQAVLSKWLGQSWSPERPVSWTHIFQVQPQPIYRAFISRTTHQDESLIPDSISQTIERWGFTLRTVGIPPLKREYTDEELLATIGSEIEKSDIFFAIATKRDHLLRNWQWRTFEWLQSETGIAYSKNKQILVFVEKGVRLSGLASKRVILQFNPHNLKEIDNFFDEHMFQIRENISKRKDTEFLYNLLTVAGVVGGITLVSVGSYYLGKSNAEK